MTKPITQQAVVYQTASIRELVDYINEKTIQKDQVLKLFQDDRNNEFVLIYYNNVRA